ncbi:zona pellucida sperm-binding protein 4-like [Latimeria chalumnae]|uniref:zona pellucida sperm-binding protein 4-like n=1 Tax=Latimeria chalumnae TaxID=7897 RepID=UPI00313EB163
MEPLKEFWKISYTDLPDPVTCEKHYIELKVPASEYDELVVGFKVLDDHGLLQDADQISEVCKYTILKDEKGSALFRTKYDGCYVRKTVRAVECTKDGHVLIVLTKKMTVPPLDLDSVHLLDEGPNCKPVNKTESFILFKIPFGTCGTTSRVAGSYVLYENEIIADRNIIRGPSGSITRDSTLRIHIQCRYMGRDSLPLNVQVFTLAPPLPVTEPGPLHLELRISKGESYGAYYHVSEYPVVKNLREPVFLEVRLLNRTDPSIVLMLDDCWATPTPNPLDKLMWKILVDGCPYTEDNYRTRLQNVDASGLKFPFHYKRFIVKTFAFVDSATEQPFKGQVYFHCSALVCHPSASEPCTMKCATVGSSK